MKRQCRLVAYSGSPAATALLRSLTADGGAEVITLTLDLGQFPDLGQVRDAALAAGAVRAHVLDVREEFARDYLLPALDAGITADGWLPLVRTLGRPLMAVKLREIAAIEEAMIAVGEEGYDLDASIVGRVVTGDRYRLTKNVAATPAAAADVEVRFEQGVPVAINDVTMSLTELIESMATIAGQHGVGRLTAVEAPAAVLLQAALRAQQDGKARLTLFRSTVAEHKELVNR